MRGEAFGLPLRSDPLDRPLFLPLQFEKVSFRADFDSSNLSNVQQSKTNALVREEGPAWAHGQLLDAWARMGGSHELSTHMHGMQEFMLWTRRDCEGTQHESHLRSWFYYGVSGQQSGDFIVMTLMSLNRQTRLYSQDYRPWMWRQGMTEWAMIP